MIRLRFPCPSRYPNGFVHPEVKSEYDIGHDWPFQCVVFQGNKQGSLRIGVIWIGVL